MPHYKHGFRNRYKKSFKEEEYSKKGSDKIHTK